jgi:mycofactocin precursor
MPDTEVIEHLSRPAGSPPEAEPPPEELVEDELLVEDVSIDGMCGVY